MLERTGLPCAATSRQLSWRDCGLCLWVFGVNVEADLGWQLCRCRWQWASPPLPPRAARCWLSPCCWLTCCASSCPRSWVWRLAAAGLSHLAESSARLAALGCRKSYLEKNNWCLDNNNLVFCFVEFACQPTSSSNCRFYIHLSLRKLYSVPLLLDRRKSLHIISFIWIFMCRVEMFNFKMVWIPCLNIGKVRKKTNKSRKSIRVNTVENVY